MTGAVLVLGVDGGNSKTDVAVADGSGRVVGRARGGNSDIYVGKEPARALDELTAAVRAALADAAVDAADLSTSVFSLAGADWPEDFELIAASLRGLGLRHEPLVVNDAMGGLRLGSPDWQGVAVVCGSFNAVGARHRDGTTFHLGFWPDRVGGFDLADLAVKAVHRDGLGLGPTTALTPRVHELFDSTDAVDLMHRFTRRGSDLGLVAHLQVAPLLLDVAGTGDEVASTIVRAAGAALGEQARVAAERVGLGLDGTPVVLAGGVLQHPSTLLSASIMARLDGAVPVRPTEPPIVGALLLAYDRLDLAMDDVLLGGGARTRRYGGGRGGDRAVR